MRTRGSLVLCLLGIALVLLAQNPPAAGDWPDWRGPQRDGTSAEKGLPENGRSAGENLAWKAPYGGRSTPVILGDRLYLENTAGSGANEQERILCLNADTGRLLWEYKFNLFQSDVPAHRVAWASPVADPETGNVYSFGVEQPAHGALRETARNCGSAPSPKSFRRSPRMEAARFRRLSTATW